MVLNMDFKGILDDVSGSAGSFIDNLTGPVVDRLTGNIKDVVDNGIKVETNNTVGFDMPKMLMVGGIILAAWYIAKKVLRIY